MAENTAPLHIHREGEPINWIHNPIARDANEQPAGEARQNPPQPNAQQPQTRLGDFDNPDAFLANRNPINPTPIQLQNFDISPQIIGLVKQNQFHGLPSEHPMDHIDLFEEICSTVKSNDVPADYLMCKLFSFSLTDRALRWLKSLPAGSLTTWEQCKSAFLKQFYTQARSNQLRNKISGFRQTCEETFYEAWERFQGYIRDCPHHGFSESNLLNTFYRGVDESYRSMLNAASNGNFMTRTVEDAYTLIDNIAASNCHSNDKTTREFTSDSNDLHNINSYIEKRFEQLTNKLLKGQHKSVHFVDDAEIEAIQPQGEDEYTDMLEEINFAQGE